MEQIECPYCGGAHKNKELKYTTFAVTHKEIKYKAFAVVCMHCGKKFDTNKTIEKTLENKEKAIAKWIKDHPKKSKELGIIATSKKSQEQIHEQAARMTDESAMAFLCGIIRQAVLDYNKTRQRRSVEDFFKSKWGAEVMYMFSFFLSIKTHINEEVTPKMVLAQLKNNGVNFDALIMDEAEQHEVCNHL